VLPFNKRAQDAEVADALEVAEKLVDVLDELEQHVRRARACAQALPAFGAELRVATDTTATEPTDGSVQAVGRSIDRLEAACLDVLTQVAYYRGRFRREVGRPGPDLSLLNTGSA
jgi:hypothetical protein